MNAAKAHLSLQQVIRSTLMPLTLLIPALMTANAMAADRYASKSSSAASTAPINAAPAALSAAHKKVVAASRNTAADTESSDFAREVARMQRDINAMKRLVEQSATGHDWSDVRFTQQVGTVSVPIGPPSDIPSFRGPLSELPIPPIMLPTGPQSFRHSWQAQSSSSWTQFGSRFRYEQPIRGVLVILEGRIARGSLVVETIEIAADSAKRSCYTCVTDVPERFRDEVEEARTAARSQVLQ